MCALKMNYGSETTQVNELNLLLQEESSSVSNKGLNNMLQKQPSSITVTLQSAYRDEYLKLLSTNLPTTL